MKKVNKYLSDVSEFHKLFQMPILNEPQIPDKKRCELRVSLIQEELNEMKKGIEENNLCEILDALCDLQYVVSGAVLEFGLIDIFDSAFAEVQKSNMSKACKTRDEAERTQKYYLENRNVETYIVERGSSFFVYRKVDDKSLKSIDYYQANLKQFLNAKRS